MAVFRAQRGCKAYGGQGRAFVGLRLGRFRVLGLGLSKLREELAVKGGCDTWSWLDPWASNFTA